MGAAEQRADLIITGRVATLAGADGFGWQSGIAIADGRVIAAGESSELESLAGPGTRRVAIDQAHAVVPGITDAHLHLMNLVLGERQIDLTGSNLPDALERVAARHQELVEAGDADGWLLGHGWSLHDLGGWPSAADLENVAPNRPVALYAHDHHTRWVSRRALELASIGARSTDPGGGLIRRDDSGQPTGILHEVASILVDSAIPEPTAADLERGLIRVAAQLAGLGITGCHDPGELTADGQISRGPLFYRALAERAVLPLRVHASIRAPQLDRAIELGLASGHRTGRFRMGWIKLFADGSLGSRSAAMLAPYTDAEANPPTGGPRGMVLTDAEELGDLLRQAAEAGISGQVHAIGDAAVRMVLDVFAGLPRGKEADSGLMRRIEHAQLIDPADVPRFGALGIAASVQPVHLRSDAVPARIGWGERAENTFPLRGLDQAGALIPFGTDAPVEPADPWPGIAVAVARRDPFRPEQQPTAPYQAIDLARALRAACLDPALVAGETDIGRLIAGCRADLVVVPAESFLGTFDASGFAAIRPLATMIDGEIVHRGPDFDA
jgi:predicted amidohydrolase YtcJ